MLKLKTQNYNSKVKTIISDSGNYKYKIERNRKTKVFLLISNKSNKNINLEVELAGEGAEAEIFGLVIGKKNNSFKLNTTQKHTSPNTTSNLLIKGAFFDKSKFEYRGLIQISKCAKNANAFQKQDNLVLSNKADIDTRPELEIKTNDVHCTHASTTSRIDEEQIYYLMSRGLSKKASEKLIIEGFIKEIVKKYNEFDKAKSLLDY
jgi:Fe-S cluster assembly protein SufD